MFCFIIHTHFYNYKISATWLAIVTMYTEWTHCLHSHKHSAKKPKYLFQLQPKNTNVLSVHQVENELYTGCKPKSIPDLFNSFCPNT